MSVTLTVEEPAWRVKSRPCEYFRRGRCVFGEDRCNFLHILNEWNPDESTFIDSTLTSRKAPDVKIYPETPPSASLRSIRSPPRSPRTTNLLLALKGIIRDDEEGEYVDDLSFEAVDDFDNQNSGRTIQQTETVPVFHDPVYDDSESSPSPTNSGLLSPVEFSDLQLKHFSLVRDAHRASLSQEYDPFGAAGSQWVSPSPMVRSPPRSPAPTSTFELIASPFGSPSNRLLVNPMSPRLNPFTPRVPIPPSPLASRFDDSEDIQQPELDLDSPTDYKEKEMQMQEEDQTARVPELPLDDEDEYTGPLTTRWDSEDTVRPFHLNPPPPRKSKTKALDGPANPSLGIQEEVKEALRRRSESPLDYFQTPETVRPPAFSPEDVEADSTSRAQASADDETAQLAYLASSPDEEVDELPGSVEEDDTINSLYDVYSDIDSESEQGEDEEQDDNDEDVCISRALPSSLKLISPTASPSTALPAYHERPSPKSTHSSSPPSARVFTPQPPTPPSPPVLVPYDKNSTDESTPLSALPRFSSSIRNSKLRPLRLSTISTTINPLPMTPPSFSPSGASGEVLPLHGSALLLM
ncbi:hypothetical protein BDP27DRAFT_750358 [Rhodocollybia butyracea]|uniref:C3H1-type domain-containing protein n=1 Tax=Rhodocollybia butyracea TaxID=206335 RepID=A0A9P5PTQ8_9AGAR|nr:hypothetical protein BDP27DRAFT_750358 [Rhodocollybia butyracea]